MHCYVARSAPETGTGIHSVPLQQWIRDLPSLSDSDADQGKRSSSSHSRHGEAMSVLSHAKHQQLSAAQDPSQQRRALLWTHLQQRLYNSITSPNPFDDTSKPSAGSMVRLFAVLSGLAVTHAELAAITHAYLVPVGVDSPSVTTDAALAARLRAALCKSTPDIARRCLTGRPVLLTSAPPAATAEAVLSSLASTTTDNVPVFLNHLAEKLPPISGLLAFHDVYFAGKDTRACVVADAVHTPNTRALSITRLTELELRQFLRMFTVEWTHDVRVALHPSLACEKREVFALLRKRKEPTAGVVGVPRTDITTTTMQAIAQTIKGTQQQQQQQQQQEEEGEGEQAHANAKSKGSNRQAQALQRERGEAIQEGLSASQLADDTALLRASSSTWLASSVLAPPASQQPPKSKAKHTRTDSNSNNKHHDNNHSEQQQQQQGKAPSKSMALVPQQRERRWATNGVLHDTMSTREAYDAVAHVLDQGPPSGCDPAQTVCNVFFVWTSHRDTWSFLNRAAVESALHTFPHARAVVVTNTLPFTFFNSLQEGHRVFVWRFVPERLMVGVPGAMWLKAALQAQGPHMPTHQSDFLRYVALLRYGGLFSDTDLVWINGATLGPAVGKNFLGKIDSRPIMRSCDWCVDKRWYLANGVMRFQRGHALVRSVLEQIDDLKYDPSDRLAIGPHLVTKTFVRLNDPSVVLLDEHILFPISGPRVLYYTDPLPPPAEMHSLLHSAALHIFEATYKTAVYVHTSAMQQAVALMPWLQHDPVCECVWQERGNLCLPYSTTTRFSYAVLSQTLTRLCIKIRGVHSDAVDGEAPASSSSSSSSTPSHHGTDVLQDAVFILEATHGRVQTMYQGAASRVVVPVSGAMSHAQALELAQLWYVHDREYCNDRVRVRVLLGNGTEYASGDVEVMAPCYDVAATQAGVLSSQLDHDTYSLAEVGQMLKCTRFSSLYQGPDPLLFLPKRYAPLVSKYSNSVTARYAHGRHSHRRGSEHQHQRVQGAEGVAQEGLGDDEQGEGEGEHAGAKGRQPTYKVGLVVVATGWYYAFLDDFVASAEEFFLPGHEVHYFVFTDNKPFASGPAGRMHILRQPVYGWPFDSMFRYQSILRQWHNFDGMDYLFLLDADIAFFSPVREEILGDTVGVAQAFSFGLPKTRYPLESYLGSVAYTPASETPCYYAGGIFGGSLSGAQRLLHNTAWLMEYDLIHGMLASHDDEGYLNRFFAWNKPSVVLPASYIYPEPPCDRAWDAGGRRYDTAFPIRILNTGCRKVLGLQPNNGRANQAPNMTPMGFLETETLMAAVPMYLSAQAGEEKGEGQEQGQNQQQQQHREEEEEEEEERQRSSDGIGCDANSGRERAEVKLADVTEPVWLVSCLSASALEADDDDDDDNDGSSSSSSSSRGGDGGEHRGSEGGNTRHSRSNARSTTKKAGTNFPPNGNWHKGKHEPKWIRNAFAAHAMVLKHTSHAHYVLGMEPEVFHAFWAWATDVAVPATLLVEQVPRCDAAGALHLMQHVHADHVVLADAGLGPGWHVNFGVWRAMLRDMRGGSSSGGGAYADQLWSIDAGTDGGGGGGGGGGNLRIAAACPQRTADGDGLVNLGKGPVSKLACGWGTSRSSARGARGKAERATRVLATDFRSYTCQQEDVAELIHNRAFMAPRGALERVLDAAVTSAAAGEEQSFGDRAATGGFVSLVVTELARAHAGTGGVEAASCFMGTQPMVDPIAIARRPPEVDLPPPRQSRRLISELVVVAGLAVAGAVATRTRLGRAAAQAALRQVRAWAAAVRNRRKGEGSLLRSKHSA